ncbi:tripartite motif-containing protein 3-like [Anneissia japonica]|uniref:tripartite motif-containing protein 3-like n=1 Tax=Anneissia japonica TaxID=1529436 RepID=UPI0014255045|nr:tripartite motif-containing protein 3-like [Anneissia japonica]
MTDSSPCFKTVRNQTLTEKMAANCFMNYIMDYNGLQGRVEIEECEVCGGIAKFHCVQCNNFICTNCKITHERRPVSDVHQFCTIAELNTHNWRQRHLREILCARHRYSISSYCKSCETPMCEKCDETHTGPQHNIIPADVAFEQYKQAAEKLVADGFQLENLTREKLATVEETKKVWVTSTVRCEKEIIAYVDRLQKQLDCAKDNLLENLNEISTQKEAQLDEEIQNLKLIKENVKSARLRNEGLMGTQNPNGALYMINEGLQQLHDALQNIPALHPVNTGNLEFDPDLECLEGFKLGSVYEGGLLDPSQCVTDITSKIEKTVGEFIQFRLTTNDSNGRKKDVITDSISVVLQNESGDQVNGDVSEICKGLFQITCLCKWETECNLSVGVFGEPISGSPFPVVGLRHQLLLKSIDTGNYFTKKKGNIDDVCFTTDDILLACNSTNQILKFDLKGNYINTFCLEEGKEIQGIFCIDFDRIAVTEKTGCEVLICKQDGVVVHQFGKGVLLNPKGIAVSVKRNEVFVVDCQAHCVFRFSIEGRLLCKIGGIGNAEGKFNTPHSIAVINEGDDFIVSDSLNHRLQVFKHDGKFLRTIGYGRGQGNGKLEFPRAVALHGKGHIIVGSSDRLQLFDQQTGQYVTRLDHRNDDVKYPYGIAVDKGKIAVANWRGLGSKSANIKTFKDAYEQLINNE